MDVDQREKAVEVTNYFFKAPSYKKTLVLLLLTSFFYGAVNKLILEKNTPFTSLFYGGSEGVLLICLPALIASTLASTLYRKEFKEKFKYYSFISLISAVVIALTYSAAGVFQKIDKSFPEILLIGYALVALIWFLACFLVLGNNKKSFILAFLQPVLGLSFLWLWIKFGAFETTLSIGSPVITFFKLIVSTTILFSALWVFFYIINAPTKRNFGMNTIDIVTLFFASWITGGKELEEALEEMSEKLKTFVGGVVFKTNNKTKALFIVPGIHFGPFGIIGGSQAPAILDKHFKQTNTTAFVFHTTVNHDWNPVNTSEVRKIIPVIEQNLKGKTTGTASFFEAFHGKSQVFGLNLGENAFVSLSRAPKSTEDIDYALGIAFRNKVISKGWKNSLIIDKHNSITNGKLIEVGSDEYYEYDSALSKIIKPKKQGKLSIGIAEKEWEGMQNSGIAKSGIKTAVIKAGDKKACIVLIDGNNIEPKLTMEARKKLLEKGFDYADVYSTDSHALNNINGVHNPIGKNNAKIALEKILESAQEATKSLEPSTASFFMENVELRVLGANRQSELQSTINSVIAITKIVAPVILIGSIILVVISLLLLR
ncbi:MAG: DUF2070 family protein [Candidatus Micrarchaeota archaeon]